ncbi:hypothetical protein NESM_000668500 [Novymonas esmeraldas]|uniref:Uncharacterized protein n=1 Tax=Novymonas esmeraldas TaxID=1808958 RepID=A0AAW0EUQ3_9TRYP
MADSDGDLSNVNPELLKLTANAEDWREQRRRAMKAKIFSGAAGGDVSNAEAYMPTSGTAGSSPAFAAPSPESAYANQQATESYILQQILSHKRRRDDGGDAQVNSAPSAPSAPAPSTQPPAAANGPELSLKEKLMRKYGKN